MPKEDRLKQTMIYFESCRDCPYCQEDFTCARMKSKKIRGEPFPKWCPLEWRERGVRPWWVEGAEVNQALEGVATYAGLARLRVDLTDNDDGFCLREQLWYDGGGQGINSEFRRMCLNVINRG